MRREKGSIREESRLLRRGEEDECHVALIFYAIHKQHLSSINSCKIDQ